MASVRIRAATRSPVVEASATSLPSAAISAPFPLVPEWSRAS